MYTRLSIVHNNQWHAHNIVAEYVTQLKKKSSRKISSQSDKNLAVGNKHPIRID